MEKMLSGFCFFFTSRFCYCFNFLRKWRMAKKMDDKPDESLSKSEIKMVMERLGIGYDSEMEELEERMGVDDFWQLVDEKPRWEEMKKAFEVWDEHGDGFIDAGELERVFCKLGMEVGSEPEVYTRMIAVADENNDGVVDFHEFFKFMKKC